MIVDGATILTADGLYFDYEQPSNFSLNAIARGLANTCRFGGQCSPFYSVAEHSINVATILPEEWRLVGLFHDAAEAFICDMPKPLKEMLPDYKAVEKRIEAALFDWLGMSLPMPTAVKHCDKVMLATEQVQLMRNRDSWKWTDSVDPLPMDLHCWTPEQAYHEFIAEAHRLGFKESFA